MRFLLISLFVIVFAYSSTKTREEIVNVLQERILLSIDPKNSNTLLFSQTPKALSFQDLLKKKPIFNQNIANYINQIYYSTKINFDFCQHFYIQSGKVFRQINMQRSSKRDEGERVRLIFIGFEY
ncbi:hypothetical protein [uncultured Helicobacter sp.]|uniref:hypothetical protein n=1 Tax=uncultured Helicobacter sp. TaxID=175537 RepID=UPI002633943A|nr:hypothetical protein [uncultured Helicobacter sp.]